MAVTLTVFEDAKIAQIVELICNFVGEALLTLTALQFRRA